MNHFKCLWVCPKKSGALLSRDDEYKKMVLYIPQAWFWMSQMILVLHYRNLCRSAHPNIIRTWSPEGCWKASLNTWWKKKSAKNIAYKGFSLLSGLISLQSGFGMGLNSIHSQQYSVATMAQKGAGRGDPRRLQFLGCGFSSSLSPDFNGIESYLVQDYPFLFIKPEVF